MLLLGCLGIFDQQEWVCEKEKRHKTHVEMAQCADTISLLQRVSLGHEKRKNVLHSFVSFLNSGAIG